MAQGLSSLDSWMNGIRRQIDAALEAFFESKCAEAARLSPRASELVVEVRELTMRGGKRLRPIVMAAAHRAAGGGDASEATVEAGASLELLQTYLLIHDDWMDQDLERRGGPAVHYAFERRHGGAHLGASLGILAGDLASTFSWELLLRSHFPTGRRDEALRLFIEIQKEVFAGQQLDLMTDPDVERMHDLKTGSYTTRGPAELGGILAGADPFSMGSLHAWSAPLGVAFQLRDDLLSTFGTVKETGKPGDDLRHGKHNAVVAAFRKLEPDAAAQAALDAVWGRPDATDEALQAAWEVLANARAEVEARLAVLVDEARSAIASSPFDPEAKSMLEEVTLRLTERGS
ncbi:MAG: polyprenyl synthetase family protein [Myxococcales bacterium]